MRFHVIFSITKSITIDDDDVLIRDLNERLISFIYIINIFRNFLTTL